MLVLFEASSRQTCGISKEGSKILLFVGQLLHVIFTIRKQDCWTQIKEESFHFPRNFEDNYFVSGNLIEEDDQWFDSRLQLHFIVIGNYKIVFAH